MARKKYNKAIEQRSKRMSKLIKKQREQVKCWSQSDLEKQSKVDSSTIKSIEQGVTKAPNIFIFLDLVKALDIKWKEINKL